MWTRKLLKDNAKLATKQNYGLTFAVCLVASILGGEGLTVISNVTSNFSSASSLSSYGTQQQLNNILGGMSENEIITTIFSIVAIILVIAVVLSILLSIFVMHPVLIGKNRYMMENRYGKSTFGTLFSTFKNGYLNIVFTMFLMEVKVFLWSLLFIIPGIIKSYEYFLVPYILAENPHMPQKRAFELSKQMTDGEKLDIFLLSLSFFGWYFLGVFTLGISNLFVNVYYEATFAEFYAAMRAKAFAMGYSNPNELTDFVKREN